MGLLQYYERKFFEELPRCDRWPQLGQVVWIIVPHLLNDPHVIEAVRQEDRSHEVARARFVKMGDNHFRKREHKDLPILNLRLAETEEVIAFKAKQRPGVVVAMNGVRFGDQPRSHHEEERCVVVPVYGIQSEDDVSGFSGIMATRVRHLLYRQYFPFAQWQERRSRQDCPEGTSIGEGILRLDRMQFVLPTRPGCQQVPLRIAKEPFKLLQAWVWSYLHATKEAKVWEELQELREMFRSYLPTQARPVGMT